MTGINANREVHLAFGWATVFLYSRVLLKRACGIRPTGADLAVCLLVTAAAVMGGFAGLTLSSDDVEHRRDVSNAHATLGFLIMITISSTILLRFPSVPRLYAGFELCKILVRLDIQKIVSKHVGIRAVPFIPLIRLCTGLALSLTRLILFLCWFTTEVAFCSILLATVTLLGFYLSRNYGDMAAALAASASAPMAIHFAKDSLSTVFGESPASRIPETEKALAWLRSNGKEVEAALLNADGSNGIEGILGSLRGLKGISLEKVEKELRGLHPLAMGGLLFNTRP